MPKCLQTSYVNCSLPEFAGVEEGKVGVGGGHHHVADEVAQVGLPGQCCQMAKFDPLLSLDCARVQGQYKERKGSK